MLDFYDEPHELPGKWQTQCQHCEWVSEFTFPYQNECEILTCPECDSDDIVDVNLKLEE